MLCKSDKPHSRSNGSGLTLPIALAILSIDCLVIMAKAYLMSSAVVQTIQVSISFTTLSNFSGFLCFSRTLEAAARSSWASSPMFAAKGSANLRLIAKDTRVSVLVTNHIGEKEVWVAFKSVAQINQGGAAKLVARIGPRYLVQNGKCR